ncbi:hypothetical protein B0I35DRAFT_406713 [Stachybotrys elegans]|uniref:Uncharacterized protein n=1 Tax=Stachybotrys elegans TaxID=80388 RepID=A0A8K0SX29_9HYPO|nr:hypothetical protein B0I35DRAFT_406713 [Stachybotrys elegans]
MAHTGAAEQDLRMHVPRDQGADRFQYIADESDSQAIGRSMWLSDQGQDAGAARACPNWTWKVGGQGAQPFVRGVSDGRPDPSVSMFRLMMTAGPTHPRVRDGGIGSQDGSDPLRAALYGRWKPGRGSVIGEHGCSTGQTAWGPRLEVATSQHCLFAQGQAAGAIWCSVYRVLATQGWVVRGIRPNRVALHLGSGKPPAGPDSPQGLGGHPVYWATVILPVQLIATGPSQPGNATWAKKRYSIEQS